jgi:hypothetical protein
MKKPNNDAPGPNDMFDPQEMEARVERLKKEGRLPTLEQLVTALAPAREQWVEFLKAQEVIRGDDQPVGLLDVAQELLKARENISTAEPVSIADYEAVRHQLLDIIGPGGYRAGIAIALGKKRIVPIRGTEDQGKQG